MAVASLCLSAALQAQFIPAGTAVPRTAKPPVVFLNGYQADCPSSPGTLSSFRSTFAQADQVMQANGQVSLFFDNCTVPNKPPIETLGRSFGEFLASLRYQDGQPIPEFDVIAHSMGGLVVRSYLAGKSTDGTFAPPATTRIRKVVFLGVPHFGSALASIAPGSDAQLRQLEPGSRFLFDLATWNQGIDDLRGIDSIAVIGNAGIEFSGLRARSHDSTVTLTSASLDFAFPGRTRVVNHCHTSFPATLLCQGEEGFLGQMVSSTHATARIVSSFLNGGEEWRTVGEASSTNPILSTSSGLALQWRDAADQPIGLRSAMVVGGGNLGIRSEQIAYADYLAAGELRLNLTSLTGNTAAVVVPPGTGGTRTVTVKSGPYIAGIFPFSARIAPRALAPGMFISIYGTSLAPQVAQAAQPYPMSLSGVEVRANGAAIPVQYVSPTQINAVLSDTVSGVVRLTVRSPEGEHTLHALVEPAVPALVPAGVHALSGALVSELNPIRPGDYLSLYLTGLGTTERRDSFDWAVVQPQVTVGGRTCELLYAGRSFGYVGLDQINCRVAADAQTSNAAPVTVRSGSRSSNVINLPLR